MASTKRFTLPFVLLFGIIYFNKLANSCCPNGFNYSVDGIPKCYSVVTQKLDWDAAQANCRQLHPKAHLVVINSALENQIIQEMLKDFDCSGTGTAANGKVFVTNNFWTSGRRASDSCNSSFFWKASSGPAQSLAYTDWYANQPDCTFNQEHCISFFSNWNMQWNDLACSWAVCSICEVANNQH